MLFTVAICTYNRCDLLRLTIDAILAQEVPGDVEWEFLIVDNNSKDRTAELVGNYAAQHRRIRYLLEPRQGVTHARNRVLAEAKGSILVCTDDDIQPAPHWLRNALRAAAAHPEWAIFGGKVLPSNPDRFPAWLTPEHYSPLALLDRGDAVLPLGPHTGLLVGANMVLRPALVGDLGGFRPELGRVKDSIGSLEDDDFFLRAIVAGRPMAYDPSIVVYTEVQEDRLRPAYHLRWSLGHGHFTALRRLPEMEQSNFYLLGAPGHVWRQAAVALARLPLSLFNGEARMLCLTRILWAAGFIRQFWRLPPAAKA